MNAGNARAIAERWVAEQVARWPDEVLAAFTYGSINWMADADPFPAGSDLDLVVVVTNLDPVRHWISKRLYGEIPVEAFYVPRERLLSAEAVLGDFGLAPNLLEAKVLFDPHRILQELRAAMAPQLGRRHWIRHRCHALRDLELSLLTAFEGSDSPYYLSAVTFHAVLGMAQMVLTADLRNPTVKKGLVKARDVLLAYGLTHEHEDLLDLFGAARLGDGAILTIAVHCRQALDLACVWQRTRFPGDNHVSVHSRPALDLDVPACVANGTGREAFAWVGFLYAHVLIAIANDAPAAVAENAGRIFLEDMSCIGLGTVPEARSRMLACRPALERMLGVADAIIAGNPRAID
jgi:hypothetical protein